MYLEKDSVLETATNISPSNRMHTDSKKRRSFLALLFAAGDAKRWASYSPRPNTDYLLQPRTKNDPGNRHLRADTH